MADPPFMVHFEDDDPTEVLTQDTFDDLLRSRRGLSVLRSNVERYHGAVPATYVFENDGLRRWVGERGTHPIDRSRRVPVSDIMRVPTRVLHQMERNLAARKGHNSGAGPSTAGPSHGRTSLREQTRDSAARAASENEELQLALQKSLENREHKPTSLDEQTQRAIQASLENAQTQRAIRDSLRGSSSSEETDMVQRALLTSLRESAGRAQLERDEEANLQTALAASRRRRRSPSSDYERDVRRRF